MQRSLWLRSALAALLLIVCTTAAQAQSPLGLELRGGVALPTGDIEDLNNGFGVGAVLTYRIMPHLSLYGGWDWNQFTSDAEGEIEETDIEDTGYNFGAMFEHPLTPALSAWVLGGGLYKHIEIEDADGEEVVSADHGLGFEVGAGLGYAVSDRFALKPGVRYRSFEPDYGEDVEGAKVTYISIDLGLAIRF